MVLEVESDDVLTAPEAADLLRIERLRSESVPGLVVVAVVPTLSGESEIAIERSTNSSKVEREEERERERKSLAEPTPSTGKSREIFIPKIPCVLKRKRKIHTEDDAKSSCRKAHTHKKREKSK